MKSNEREAGIKGMRGKIKLWMWLSGINLFISAFTFGGGYVVVPMIRKYFVFSEETVQRRGTDEYGGDRPGSPGPSL